MAFQPKSYRKFMVASASAALAASAVAPAAASAAETETAAEAFTDVTVDTPHYEHINALYQEGVINGFEDGEFKRNQYVPRSQAAEMFFNALDLEEAENTSNLTFDDVNERLAGEILALVNEDIVDGHSEEDFGYAENLTRDQAAKMIAQAFGVPQDVPEADFTDLMETSLYVHVSAVAEAGIVDGYPDGSFGVGEPIKRGDFAKMFHNALNYWQDNQDTSVTVSEVGSVKSTLPGVFGVEIKLDALEGASADTAVSLDVDGETVELTYDADRESFKNIQVSGYSEEELNNAEVVYDSGDEDSSDDSESTELGTVTDLEGSVKGTLPGVYGVELSVDNLENVDAGTDEVALVVDGEEVALSYDESRDSYKNIQISGYTQAQLEAATVIVK